MVEELILLFITRCSTHETICL